ncbi:MAG TPA: gamma-glutamyltransferase, partial [Alphaproteobacteria bacterium]|nr:gamma-glutamyltransferase [Alphaproteobacteria bacterium]
MAAPASPPFTTRPEIAGTFGVVSSTHWLASQIGMAVLEKGGNAFDAAVAAGFMLQVVEPHMNGIGGDAVMLVQPNGAAMPTVICGQGTAPAGATIAHYKREGLELVPGTGLLAAVIPGAFDAWMLMLRDHGTMKLEELITPAIDYARNGYPLIAGVTGAISNVAELFRTEWTTSAAVYLPGGKVPATGSLFRNVKLGDTYARLLKEAQNAGGDRIKQIEAARAAFYKGFVAEAIEAYATKTDVLDASGKKHKGVLKAADMAG